MTDNELIANFMGLEFGKNADHNGFLKYDSSWDWLMPVVLKIEKELWKDGAQKNEDWTVWNDHFDGAVFTDINLVYPAVIGFIKWHESFNK